ncbi:MAG: PadR family transcriptional regulator [Actinomycetota bacterium]
MATTSTYPVQLVLKELLKASVLLCIAERPVHGYEILDRLEAVGGLGADTGNLYRLLSRLEEERLVRSSVTPSGLGPARRVYRISKRGQRWLRTYSDTVPAAIRLLERYARRYRRLEARVSD